MSASVVPAPVDVHAPTRLPGLRLVGTLEAVVGTGLAIAPGAASRAIGGAAPPRWIAQLLGLRMAAQGLTLVARPSVLVALAGAVADTAHAASMLPVGRWAPRYRRPAYASAAVAASFATALAVCVGSDEGLLVLRARLAALRHPAVEPASSR